MGDKDIHCQIAHDNIFRVPTSSGNHGKPGKSRKKSMHGKIIKFEKKPLNYHGKIMEFCEII